MRKLLSIFVVITAFTLAGCGTTANTGGTPAPAPSVSEIIQRAQVIATQVCGFAPAGDVLAQVLSTVPTVGGVAVIAAALGNAVCQAVSQAPTLRARLRAKKIGPFTVTPGAVNGVPIR